jgi:hypothetical protein
MTINDNAYPSPNPHQQRTIANCLLPTAFCQLPFANCQLFITPLQRFAQIIRIG